MRINTPTAPKQKTTAATNIIAILFAVPLIGIAGLMIAFKMDINISGFGSSMSNCELSPSVDSCGSMSEFVKESRKQERNK